jgi:tetrapyrrole methylase family protein / MazG family protein
VAARRTTFPDLVRVMHRLRAPGGCPWDARQTHASLLKYIREESREVCDAVRRKDWDNLEEELGDVLLQVLFHSELAAERGEFDINDVMATLRSKLIRRHPHVFGTKKNPGISLLDLNKQWATIKKAEKKRRTRRR